MNNKRTVHVAYACGVPQDYESNDNVVSRGPGSQDWEKPMFLENVFWILGFQGFRFLKVFKGFLKIQYTKKRLDIKFRPRKNILCTILSVTSFSINYNKTHKSQFKCEIKSCLYKISPKIFLNQKKQNFGLLGVFRVFKNLETFQSHFAVLVK